MKIPMVDLVPQNAEVDSSVRAGWDKVIRSGAFIGGDAVVEFENAYAAFVGTQHCVAVANGTDAIELALRACGVEAGGEVILPANTFVATAEAVVRIGATPVLVDVDPTHLLIDPDMVVPAISERTQAIVAVHLFGQSAPVERLLPLAEAAGAVVVEDAAQAQGAMRNGRVAGSWGAAAATSFYPGKNLGAYGDAGGVTTVDPGIARQIRLLGAHGSEQKYHHEIVGFNSRMDALQAVVLSAKLERLVGWNRSRAEAAARYSDLLQGIGDLQLPRVADGNIDAWHLYVVRTSRRNEVLEALGDAGVEAGIHYPSPVHLTPAFGYLGFGAGSFPVAEEASGQILSLPIHPHLSREDQAHVASVIRAVLAS